MAIVRCDNHPVDARRAKNIYVKRTKPFGYPNTAAICGSKNCVIPGYVWLTKEDLEQIERGERYLTIDTALVRLGVTGDLLDLPAEYADQVSDKIRHDSSQVP